MSLIREFTKIVGESQRQYKNVIGKPLILTEEVGAEAAGMRENFLSRRQQSLYENFAR